MQKINTSYFYFMMISKHKNNDSGYIDMPNQQDKLFPFSEKLKVHNLIRKEKHCIKESTPSETWTYTLSLP